VRHSTGEVIEGISIDDVGQVIAALSQTLVVLFPTRDNRREVVHIDSIEAVEKKSKSR
jgi:ribosomal protein L6P/L9E